MKVAHCPRRFVKEEWGGTETVVLNYCQQLEKAGISTDIFTSMALSAVSKEEIEGVTVHRSPHFYPYWGLTETAKRAMDKQGGNLFSYKLFYDLLASKPDLIHLHTSKRMGGIARTVSRLLNIPFVVSLHGGIFNVPGKEAAQLNALGSGAVEWGKLLGLAFGSRRVLKDAAAVLCLNRSEEEAIKEQVPGVKTFCLPNGVDVDQFQLGNGERFRKKFNIPPNRKILLTVARIGPQKNQLAMIELLDRLLAAGEDVHVVLIGSVTDEHYYRKLCKRVQELQVEERITIIPGLTPDDETLTDAYQAADVFVLPSSHEPFGIVVLEAWAAGLPVVTSNVGGLVDLIEPESNGYRVPIEDGEALKASVQQLLHSEPERMRIAEAGFQTVTEQYTWSAVVRQLRDIYDEVLDEYTVHQSQRRTVWGS